MFVSPTTYHMKRTNIIFWISTGLLAAAMFASGVQNMLITTDSVALITDQLGYPKYIIGFLGIAKMLGVIAILIPGYPRIKEWAYAGLFFDLLGAFYSTIASVGEFRPEMLGMLPFFLLWALSYIYYHKRLREQGKPALQGSVA
jgi:uncharacterized membrane protein